MKLTKYNLNGPNLRAVVVADLHDREASNVVEKIKELKPDVIFIPGDLTSHKIDSKKNHNTLNTLRKLVSISPVFYSRGNHEWVFDENDIKAIRSLGVTFLDNEFVHFGEFVIGGQKSAQRCGIHHIKDDKPEIQWLNDYVNEEGYHILLNHHPEYISNVPSKVELVLSGHAHGGQWIIFNHGIFAPGQGLFPKYTKGQYGNMILSAGLTNTVMLPRIGNPTELIYIEIGEENG